jgi:PAS domain-containing protein
MNVTEESQGAGAAAQAAYREKQQQSMMQSFASTSTDHIQSTTGQQQQSTTSTGTTDAYDMSTYDPLQAHAYQLSACAGYTGGVSNNNGATTNGQQQSLAPAPSQQQQQQQQPVPVQPRQPDQQQQQQQMFYYAPQQQQQQQQQQGVSYTIANMPTQQQRQQVMATTAQPAPVNGAPQHQYYMTPAPIPQHYGVLQSQGSTASVVSAQSQQQVQPNYGQAAPVVNGNNKRSLDVTPPSMMPSNKRQQMTTIPGNVFPQQMDGGANLIKQELVAPPHVPSASTSSSIAGIDDDDIDPIHRKPPPNYATMTADEKRRYDRNIREQQRSFKISQQIKELRNVLAESSIPFKPNKFSILMRVVEYIKQLQSRAIMLDAEHRKLIDTIQQTSDMVNSGQTPDDTCSTQTDTSAPIGNDAELMLVQGLDYKSIFAQCTAGLGVAALDGRILACNEEFAAISGFTKEDMLRQSVFNLMQNHEVVFRAMGEMLSNSSTPETAEDKNGIPPAPPLYWSGAVNQKNQNVSAY